MFGKYCRRVEQSFWTQGFLKKRGIPKKGLVFATKLEQYTCISLINYLLYLGSFFLMKEELLDNLFSFDNYHLINKLVWPPCGLGSAARTLWCRRNYVYMCTAREWSQH